MKALLGLGLLALGCASEPAPTRAARGTLVSSVGSMSAPRALVAGLRLEDGRVLITGGLDAATPGASATALVDVYDPAKGTFAALAPMLHARAAHAAVQLRDGRVLVHGGIDRLTQLTSAELFDPAKNTWLDVTDPTLDGTGFEAAALLADGRALFVGGGFGFARVFDPKTKAWSLLASLSIDRFRLTLTALPDGKLVALGGGPEGVVGSRSLSTGEIYDPAVDRWFPLPSMHRRRAGHTATLLADGKRIVVAGGAENGILGGAAVDQIEVLDLTARTWKTLGSLSAPRVGHSGTLLPSGNVLFAGGSPGGPFTDVHHASVDLLEVDRESVRSLAPLLAPRSLHYGVALVDGRVLLVGGRNTEVLASAERVELRPPGSACAKGAECESGVCIDGVCCTTACSAPCEACNVPGSVGVCTAVTGAPRAGHTRCGGFTCDEKGCRSACAADADCATGFVCQGGLCIAQVPTATCSLDRYSSAGVDGVRSCAPYLCGPDGSCRKRCEASDQCVPGTSCDLASGVCTTGGTAAGDGCAIQAGSHGVFGASLAVALGLVRALRRRRLSAR